MWAEWASRVTGSLSAILVLTGLGISIAGAFGAKVPADSIIQLGTWLLAAICGGQAAFSVWAREHKQKLYLDEKLTPKIAFSIPEKNGVLTIPVQSGALSKWVQITVQSVTDAPLVECEVWVNDIVRLNHDGTEVSIFDEPARCEWSQRQGIFTLTIRPGVLQRANLLSLFEETSATHPVSIPIPRLDFVKIILNTEIQTPGRYRIRLVATADKTPSVHKSFIFEWSDFDNVALREDAASGASSAVIDVPAQPPGPTQDIRYRL